MPCAWGVSYQASAGSRSSVTGTGWIGGTDVRQEVEEELAEGGVPAGPYVTELGVREDVPHGVRGRVLLGERWGLRSTELAARAWTAPKSRAPWRQITASPSRPVPGRSRMLATGRSIHCAVTIRPERACSRTVSASRIMTTRCPSFSRLDGVS
ncbi:hypothetical protein ACFY7C_00355 [Streptomyces sp. NPDC012769]|uniref:hypothetical protein n=1 Tax=Streptomyces sp. NPDC012769 TaxID=3364848 RepID=UPI00367BEE7B